MSNEEDNLFAGAEIEDKTEVSLENDTIPHHLDAKWSDYVLSLFAPDELVDVNGAKPLVSGLRRVAEILIGEIVSSGPTQVFPPAEGRGPGRATVVFEVIFENGKRYAEVADCWEGNTDDAFVVFNTATASTRAEARCLRKALKLKTVSAEEITSKNTTKTALEASRAKSTEESDGEFANEAPRSAKQDSFINTLCDRAGIDRGKYLKYVFGVEDDNKLSKKIASDAITQLNSYIQKKDETPIEITK